MITEIPVASFAAWRAFRTVSWDDYHVHLEGAPPSGWQNMPCKRASDKGEGQSLSFQGLTFLPLDAAAPLFDLEGIIGEFSKLFFPIKSPPTRRPSTGCSLTTRTNPKVSMWRPPILTFPSRRPWRGSLIFSRRSSASKPSIPGPMPRVLHLLLRVQNK